MIETTPGTRDLAARAHAVGVGPGVRLVVETVTADGAVLAGGADPDLAVALRMLPDGDRLAVAVDVSCAAEAPVERCVRVRAELAGVDHPGWLIPGAFYGDNGPGGGVGGVGSVGGGTGGRTGSGRAYPRFAVGRRDPAAMVSDAWELRADRAATPAVFGWGPAGGVALVVAPETPLGMPGLGLAHDADARVASVHVTVPFREGPVSYDGSPMPRPAELTTHEWQPGETVTLELEAWLLGPDRHGYAPVLRDVHARAVRAAAPVAPRVGVGQAAEVAAHGLLRWHFDRDPGVLLETAAFDREVLGPGGRPVDRQAMHVGWVSGIPWAYALLRHGLRVGDEAAASAGRAVIDHVCSALSPSGTFWGVWYRDRGWAQSWTPVRGGLHARTLGEATLFLERAIALLDGRGEPVPLAWRAAAASNLATVVRRQRADGNLGALHHARTGAVLSWAGAAGLVWVAALAEAWTASGEDAYLAAAQRAGEYYARFVEAECVVGAPEDTDLAPTSEDGYCAVMAYTALHRATGDARWLDLARRAADWALTFRYTYDAAFPPGTPLAAWGFRTLGADQASPANQHLHAYGLVCTRELVELSAALGDGWYAERAAEALACFRQLVPTFDGEYGAYRGMITERYYQTACFQPKGMVLGLSHAWATGVLLLACEDAVGVDVAAYRVGR